MIIPISFTVENFLSFKDKQTFSFGEKGMHWIYGINYDSYNKELDKIENEELDVSKFSNGSGKSSFTFILEFAFYGTISKNINKNNIINKKSKKNCYVSLLFKDTNTDTLYKINRYRKHSKHASNVYLFKKEEDKWVDLTKTKKSFTQNEILKIIEINLITFRKTNLLSREDTKQFLDLNQNDKSEIFDNVINLNKLIEYHKRNSKKIKNIKSKYDEIVKMLISVDTSINNNNSYIQKLKDNRDSKIKDLTEENVSLKKKISMLSSINIEEIKNTIKNNEINNNLILEKRNVLEKTELNLNSIISEINLLTSSIKHKEKIISDNNKTILTIKNNLVECEKCGHKNNWDNIEKEILIIEKNNIKYNEELILEKNKKIELNEKLEKIKDYINIVNDDISELKSKIINVISNNDILEIENYQNMIEVNNIKIEQLKEVPEVSQIEANIKKLNKQKEKLNIEKEKYNKYLEISKFLDNILNIKNEISIKQYLLYEIIPVFNNILNDIVSYVYNNQLSISFDSNFNPSIIYNGEEFEYNEFSTGEKTKLNLCINFAIFDLTRGNLNTMGILFLDEIFSFIDHNSIEIFVEFIKEKYSNDFIVYNISHVKGIEDLIKPKTKTLISKENNDSVICIV